MRRSLLPVTASDPDGDSVTLQRERAAAGADDRPDERPDLGHALASQRGRLSVGHGDRVWPAV